jgi:hypothetical protein
MSAQVNDTTAAFPAWQQQQQLASHSLCVTDTVTVDRCRLLSSWKQGLMVVQQHNVAGRLRSKDV